MSIENIAPNTYPVYYDITNSKYFIVKNSIRYDFNLNINTNTNTINNRTLIIPGLTTTATVNIIQSQTDTTIYNVNDTQIYKEINISPALLSASALSPASARAPAPARASSPAPAAATSPAPCLAPEAPAPAAAPPSSSTTIYENFFTELTLSLIILNNIINSNIPISQFPQIQLAITDFLIPVGREVPAPT